jgi:CubicO group peptidase (beta-lactamase class C family)
MKKILIITMSLLLCIFATGKSPSVSMTDDSIEIKIDTMIARMGLSAGTPGGVVGVIRDGRLIFTKAYGLADIDTKEPNTTSTLFNLASVSKQFTGAAILILANEKKLSVKDDIRKYLPGFPDYGYPVTIENLVHHTCGIRSYDVLELMAGTLFSTQNQEEVYNLICKQKALNFTPGDEYLYSNSGYVLLADIIEKVSGMSFSRFVEEKIFKPLGMNHTVIFDYPEKSIINSASGHTWGDTEKFKRTPEQNNTVVGESNIYISLEDFLKWDNNFYRNRLGEWDFAKGMTSRTTLRSGDTCYYAFGLEIAEHNGLRTVSHQGGTGDFTAQYVSIPSENFAVVCLFNIPVDVTSLAYKITDLYIKGDQKQSDTQIKPEKAKVDSSMLDIYAGKYFDDNHGFGATISREGDHLIFDAPFQGRFELYASSDSSFFVTFADLKFIFSKNDKGAIAKLTILQNDQKFSLPYLGTNIFPLKGDELNKYAGDYFCDDINVTYPVLCKDNKLYVRFPESTAHFCKTGIETELISNHSDNFDSPVGGFQFTRDNNNEISGFLIKDLGRVRNLAFSRVK